MTETTRQWKPERDARSLSLGTILFGLILVSLGLLWLVDVAGIISVTWTLVSAVMLILVGIALLVGAREGSHGGLVFIGIVLTFVVVIGSVASWPSFGDGVGDRVVTPETPTEVESSYNWGIGSHELDLRAIDFPEGITEITVQSGIGETLIRVPADVELHVEWQVGVGDVQVLERNQSGVGLRGTYESEGYEGAERQLSIEIQHGMGAVEVRQ